MSDRVPKLEWEFFKWPIEFTNIQCANGYYNFPSDSILKIERDNSYKLKFSISGVTDTDSDFEYQNQSLEKGKLMPGETITGFNRPFENFTAEGIHVSNSNSRTTGIPDNIKHHFKCNLIGHEFTQVISDAEPDGIIEFYLLGKTNFLYPRTTDFDTVTKYTKIRHGIEPDTKRELISEQGGDNARDFFFIKTDTFECFVQSVKEQYLPEWANGLQIEYRIREKTIPEENIRKAVSELVGFIFGTQLLRVGTVYLDSVDNVLKKVAISPWGQNVVARVRSHARPPIKLDEYNDWLRVERIINDLLPNYISKREELKFTDVLWKYWISRSLAIGTNLPILSSALETLAESYTEANTLNRKYTTEEKDNYRILLKEYIQVFEDKLLGFDFKKRLIDKLQNPFNPTGGEKLKLFFEVLGFDFSNKSVEQTALRARNAMSHGSIDTDEENIQKYVDLSVAYEITFHRILLKILGYDEKYLDYYHPDSIERNLTDNFEQKS